MKNLIAVDIGNTNITIGSFKGGKLVDKIKIPTGCYSLYGKTLKKAVKDSGAEAALISSVVPLTLSRVLVALNRISGLRIVILGKDKTVPIVNKYRAKKEVGQDRLVSAYGAKAIYGSPCVVIDFGTAITFDVVSKKGEYLGGLILPGIEMGLTSLYNNTALLPKVDLKPAFHIIGKDTVSSMRGGILFGYGSMIDGLTAKYRKVLGKKLKVVATGGNAALIKRYASSIQIVDEDLILKSLAMLAL